MLSRLAETFTASFVCVGSLGITTRDSCQTPSHRMASVLSFPLTIVPYFTPYHEAPLELPEALSYVDCGPSPNETIPLRDPDAMQRHRDRCRHAHAIRPVCVQYSSHCSILAQNKELVKSPFLLKDFFWFFSPHCFVQRYAVLG